MKKGFKTLLEEAQSSVGDCSIDKARAMLGDSDVVFVEVRDDKELETHGWIPRAVHASRGLLEFYLDPESPFHKPQLTRGKLPVFHCGSGWLLGIIGCARQGDGNRARNSYRSRFECLEECSWSIEWHD